MPGSACGYIGPGSPSTGVSKHYFTVFDVPGLPGGAELLLVGAHRDSKPTDPRNCAQRAGQAAVLADLVHKHRKGRHVVLLGDFNDFDGATPDASGNTPTSSVMRQFEKLGLKNVASNVPVDERWTWASDGERHPRAALDHVLVSESLAPLVEDVSVGRLDREASDHRPVVQAANGWRGAERNLRYLRRFRRGGKRRGGRSGIRGRASGAASSPSV